MRPACFLFLLASLLYFPAGSRARQAPADSLRNQAIEATRKLATEIPLDDGRIPKVRALTYERLVQEHNAVMLYRIDPTRQANKLRGIEEDYNAKLKAIVTEAQYGRYLAQHPPTPAPATAVAPARKPKPAPAKKKPAPQRKQATGTNLRPAATLRGSAPSARQQPVPRR